jgi:hypothetical protein
LPFTPKPTNPLPTVLSRPQFLVSSLDVVGEIEDEERPADPLAAGLALGPAFAVTLPKVHRVKIDQVLYPPNSPLQPGATIGVTNFRECRIPSSKPDQPPAPLPEKLSSLGQVLLPLRPLNDGLTWEVVPLPPAPGFSPVVPTAPSPGFNRFMDYRIYPADPETLAQYRQIGK